MSRSVRKHLAAWAALLAMALHALSPLAAPAPRDAAGPLHDICSSAPATPQPAGDPSTSHCALCVASASITNTSAVPHLLAVGFEGHFLEKRPRYARPSHLAAPPRGPPAGA